MLIAVVVVVVVVIHSYSQVSIEIRVYHYHFRVREVNTDKETQTSVSVYSIIEVDSGSKDLQLPQAPDIYSMYIYQAYLNLLGNKRKLISTSRLHLLCWYKQKIV